MKKVILIAIGISFVISGCATSNPSVPVSKKDIQESNITIEQNDCNDSAFCKDYIDLKKAVAKLIIENKKYKDILESSNNLEKKLNESMYVQAQNYKAIENKVKSLQKQQSELKKKADDGTMISSSCVGKKPKSYYVDFDANAKYQIKRSYSVSIRNCPYPESKIVGKIEVAEEVKFKTCNKFGWCELEDGRGFVAGHLFKKSDKGL